jgi:uncharacterized protein YjbI with pentapeptide repeats
MRETDQTDQTEKAKKKPAGQNPWYVLATLAGEHPKRTWYWKRREQNRRYWNAWMWQGMTEAAQAARNETAGRDIFADTPDWATVGAEVEQLFAARLPGAPLPDPKDAIDFGNVEFPAPVSFDGFVFPGSVAFFEASFADMANFGRASFAKGANFYHASFAEGAHFNSASFAEKADFDRASFAKWANFIRASFAKEAMFEGGRFEQAADFHHARFSGPAQFQRCVFAERADFTDAQFAAPANFRAAQFKTAYPRLEGTLLHDKTHVSAEDQYWPPTKTHQSDQDQDKNEEAARTSCAYLRHNMTLQGLTEDAHFFFRREMTHKARRARWWERPFYILYRGVEYGYGVWQPLMGLSIVWLVGFIALTECAALGWCAAIGLSFANIFRFFGFQATYFQEVIPNLPGWLNFIGGAQTVLGYLLLFFLALGLRNRFRLK